MERIQHKYQQIWFPLISKMIFIIEHEEQQVEVLLIILELKVNSETKVIVSLLLYQYMQFTKQICSNYKIVDPDGLPTI